MTTACRLALVPRRSKHASGFACVLRASVAGAAIAIGAGSLLAAASGEPSAWVSPLGVDARPWNAGVGALLVALAASCVWPLRTKGSDKRSAFAPSPVRRLLACLAFLPLLASALDAFTYYELVASGAIHSRRALPASLLVALVTALGAWLTLRGPRSAPSVRQLALALPAGAAGALAALVSLLLAFGATDYRRGADCIVVLGARVYADGTPSLSLADRVAQGIELWRAGYAPTLVMSGGVDPGHGLSEARVMARLAEEAGVPARAIVLDEAGVDTRASAENCAELARRRGFASALLVSHDYHLLRAKAAFARAGVAAFTVPAAETRPLARRHQFLLRECAAWFWYALPATST